MTTEGNANPMNPAPDPGSTPQSPAPAGRETSGAPGGASAADFDNARNRDAAQHVERAASLSTSDIHAEAKKLLDDPKSSYWKGEGEEHDHAVATVFRSRELKAAAEGNGPAEEMTTSTRLANRAVSLGDLPIAKEMMNPQAVESDVDLGNALRFFDSQNISTRTLKRALSSYANMLAATGGRITDQGIAMLEREVGHEFHPQQKALLVRWLKEEVEPSLAKLRARRGR